MATQFEELAPRIITMLKADFDLSLLGAVAIVGNLGHESGGFRFLQEKKPMVAGSKGGWGWAQWTGPRRRQFEAYCRRNNIDPSSYKANYGFLFVELKGSERGAIPAVRKAQTLEAKVVAFEKAFERAGIKHYESRIIWARRALEAYKSAHELDSVAVVIPHEENEDDPTFDVPEAKQPSWWDRLLSLFGWR